ncbi:MAG: F0F1 ATP synthase subunit B [Candidatus Doudnabacteria bacterium]|nr:F0F1 ATP synthase subunit B [Candidatus Doudnabacteria bacterium]
MDIQSIILAASEAVAEAAKSETSEGVLGTLGINWRLFIAQLINFGIILYIFWRWIVRPLGKTLTDRQARIEQGLRNATAMDEERKKFEEQKVQDLRKIRTEADQIIRSATDTATKMKQEIIHEAQSQTDKLVDQTRQSLAAEKEQMLREVKTEVATLVVTASEKILRSKLDPRKDHELINESLKSIK